MFGKGLVKKLSAALVVAGCAFVAVVALGATVYYALQLVVVPLAAAAITAALFAVVAMAVAMVFLGAGKPEEEEVDEEPEGLGGRAYALFRSRPVLGTVAALAGGWIFLRNPALATMVAAAFTEKSHKRYRR
ncbi:hypothetical protein BZG35_00540 [Brevundimonas sp. LM2]|uniref:hypothetical protein n=1 Tax=Brevundimonas sp. LM2 TaxID=1938605 RepID=UPI000983D246|nr:hypothetical protein [Brevundimonas sp. LM2]AQR60308.1 hypothetical protein BZG35_00540 [Brevundimonas sp. LM2]